MAKPVKDCERSLTGMTGTRNHGRRLRKQQGISLQIVPEKKEN